MSGQKVPVVFLKCRKVTKLVTKYVTEIESESLFSSHKRYSENECSPIQSAWITLCVLLSLLIAQLFRSIELEVDLGWIYRNYIKAFPAWTQCLVALFFFNTSALGSRLTCHSLIANIANTETWTKDFTLVWSWENMKTGIASEENM